MHTHDDRSTASATGTGRDVSEFLLGDTFGDAQTTVPSDDAVRRETEEGAGPEQTGGSVLIIDSQSMLAGGLAMVLTAMGCGVRTLKSRQLEDLTHELANSQFDLVLVRIQPGPSLVSSLDLVEAAAVDGATVAVISESTHDLLFAAAVERGAHALLPTADPIAETVDRVLRLLQGKDLVKPQRRSELITRINEHRNQREGRFMPFETLSRREGEVLRFLMDGMSVNKIAETSFVSVGTVRTQVKAVLRKLGVSSQVAAVALAYKSGWHQTDPGLPVDLRFQ